MNTLPRRRFLSLAASALVLAPRLVSGAGVIRPVDLRDRCRGLVFGSALGDAFGGPIEFQPRETVQKLPDPPKAWGDSEVLDAPARAAAAGRLRLRSYAGIRPKPESYAMWNVDAEPGTITDDTRHKLVLFDALQAAESKGADLGPRDLAESYLRWTAQPAVRRNAGYQSLAADWLEEWQLASRWVLGERDPKKARPPECLWQGLPTCCGQMTLLPLAALFPGEPERAYRAAWNLGFFDNGFGKDLNAALVAGLAAALVTPVDPAAPMAAVDDVVAVMRRTDPFGYAKIRYTTRSVDRWLDLAFRLAREADHRPARFFARLEDEFRRTIKWEAQVPFVVAFGCLALAEGDPLAALELSLEWGHDTDSFAQLTGALVGALHGSGMFLPEWREAVKTRLITDLDVDLEEACALLDRLRRRARSQPVVRVD